MTSDCDHTSVGVLVWRNGKLLMIERRHPPIGIAPPAGHVDHQGTFEEAAKSELRDEVGLEASRFTVIWSGAKTNPCRRPGGNWHYWRVYEAEANGVVTPSKSETKDARWYTLSEIVELKRRSTEVAGRIWTVG